MEDSLTEDFLTLKLVREFRIYEYEYEILNEYLLQNTSCICKIYISREPMLMVEIILISSILIE